MAQTLKQFLSALAEEQGKKIEVVENPGMDNEAVVKDGFKSAQEALNYIKKNYKSDEHVDVRVNGEYVY